MENYTHRCYNIFTIEFREENAMKVCIIQPYYTFDPKDTAY